MFKALGRAPARRPCAVDPAAGALPSTKGVLVMVAIIDYGVGNLFSLRSSFAAIGEQAEVTGDAARIAQADRVILPGVGAFADAYAKLCESGHGRGSAPRGASPASPSWASAWACSCSSSGAMSTASTRVSA